MPLVKFAVIGCGNIGLRHLAVLAELPNAEVVAICDPDPIRLAQGVDRYPDAKAFGSLDELLAGCVANVISICTPHYLHAEHTLQAVAAGRHVLVEKPMALSVADADRMIAAAQAAGVLLMVVKQNRYNVPVALTKRALESAHFGRLLMVQCNVVWNRYDGYYRQSPWLGRKGLEGGALFTQVSHFIDLLIWTCGNIVDAGGLIETKNHDIEIEDCGSAWLRFDSGVMGSLFWTTCAYNRNFEGSMTILGEKGIVKIGGQYLNQIEHWDVEGAPLPAGIEWNDRPNAYGKYQGSSSNHDKVFRDVIAAVNRDACSVVSGEEGKKTVEAIELLYSRCSNGR